MIKRFFSAHPYLISSIILLSILLISIMVGSVFIPVRQILNIVANTITNHPLPESLHALSSIIIKLRIPRVILVALTGAALSGSGAAYQGLFRNPLADPYLIGVASGAGLGAIIAMSLNWPYKIGNMLLIPLAAFIGAIFTVWLVTQLAKVRQTVPTTNLILAGVAISSFFTALTSLMMLISTDELHRALSWLLGGGAISGWRPVISILPYLLIGGFLLILMGHPLNVLQFGEEQAQQLGIPVKRVQRIVIVAASMVSAAAVAYAGIIGFIGLIVPHAIRLIWTGNYKQLIPLAMINGATVLLLSDMLARTILSPRELPVGIITAMFGAPFFLWILRQSRDKVSW
ncbi:MAG: iron ABC transporter permease [Anaerolineaceae bacterium]|nr:iron ABC transporter permease [Anaerolineaceae bacterium]